MSEVQEDEENVVDLFTKNKVDRRKKPSNQVQVVLARYAEFLAKTPSRSIVICSIDDNGEHMTDFIVHHEDFSKMCVLLGTVSDEMSDHSMGFVDVEEE